MNIRTLRTVLLIQSIEESDRDGSVLPLADRAEATREAARSMPRAGIAQPGAELSRSAERFLGKRAHRLLDHVKARSPAVDHVFAAAGGLTWLGRVVLVLATLVGFSMSALDGSRRISILAFPLFGLIVWNLFVYALVIGARLRGRVTVSPGRSRWWAVLIEHGVGGRIDALLKQSTRFNAPLAAGLKRFVTEWAELTQPHLVERAKRVMHGAAVLVAVGLVAGLYFRGIALRYEAGWESTFLGPRAVRTWLYFIFGPASWLTGIPLPNTDGINALQWTGSGGGGPAASWIHLIACTALIYIVVPRWILVAVSTLKLWRLNARMPTPPSLLTYARTLIAGAAGGVVSDSATAVPFAYEPGAASLAGLKPLLVATLGGSVQVEVRAPVKYGDEDKIQPAPDWNVLVMNLASTPEAENHGLVIRSLRDSLARASGASAGAWAAAGAGAGALPLLVVVDSGPYAERMKGDASFDLRLRERQTLWEDFVKGYGVRVTVADLTRSK